MHHVLPSAGQAQGKSLHPVLKTAIVPDRWCYAHPVSAQATWSAWWRSLWRPPGKLASSSKQRIGFKQVGGQGSGWWCGGVITSWEWARGGRPAIAFLGAGSAGGPPLLPGCRPARVKVAMPWHNSPLRALLASRYAACGTSWRLLSVLWCWWPLLTASQHAERAT